MNLQQINNIGLHYGKLSTLFNSSNKEYVELCLTNNLKNTTDIEELKRSAKVFWSSEFFQVASNRLEELMSEEDYFDFISDNGLV